MAVQPVPPAAVDPARRLELRRLDRLLDRLEEVNVRGLRALPSSLLSALRSEGIHCEPATPPKALMREVWRRQEPLLQPGAERGRGSRRRLAVLDLLD